MKARWLISFATIITLCAVQSAVGQQQIECSGNPDACAFFKHFIDALNRRDWDQFRASLADDITVMFDSPAAPERKDRRSAVEAMFRPLFPDSGATPARSRYLFKPEGVLLQDLGDGVVVTFHLKLPDGLARRTLVLRKLKASWEVIHIHASSFSVARQ